MTEKIQADQNAPVAPDFLEDLKKRTQAMEDNTKKLVEESGGTLRLPAEQETKDLQDDRAPFINKFMVAMLRNNAVKIGFSVEYNEKTPSTYISGVVTTIHDVATLHNLLTRLLTSYQQHQQSMIQAAQAKVNPGFVKTLEAMQEAQKG